LDYTDKIMKISGFIKKYYAPVLLFIIVFIVYLNTLLPGTGYSGDSAKFQFSSRILGVPHTTGYPAYSLISHLFYLIPAGNPAFRINMMSAFFAALAIVFLFFIITRIINNKPVAFISALLFSVSLNFWSQAVVAEVYTFNAFYITAVIFTLMLWHYEKEPRYFFLSFFLYAMSFGNHLTMILIAPAIIYLIVINDYKILIKPENVLIITGFFLISAMQYLYVYIRSCCPAAYVEMWVYNFKDFLWWITGGQFKGKMFTFGLADIITERLPLYFLQLKNQFLFVGMIAGLAGLSIFLRDKFKLAVFFILIFIGNLFYSLNYNILDISVYFIPSFIVFSIFISFALDAFCRDISGLKAMDKKLGKMTALVFMVFLAALIFVKNRGKVDQSENTWPDKYSEYILENVKNNSVLLAADYPSGQYFLYKLIGEQKRKNDKIFVHWYWHPSGIVESYPSYVRNPGLLKNEISEFKASFLERDKSVISPAIFNRTIPAGMNLYFDGEDKKEIDRIGLNSRKAISISEYGYGVDIYEVMPQGRKTAGNSLIVKNPDMGQVSLVLKDVIERFHNTGSLKIDFTPKTRNLLSRGWSISEFADNEFPMCWATSMESEVVLPVKEPCGLDMEIKVTPYVYKDCPRQWIRIIVNDRFVSMIMLENAWNNYSVYIPENYWKKGWNTLQYSYNHQASPSELYGDGDKRKFSVAFSYIEFKKHDSEIIKQ